MTTAGFSRVTCHRPHPPAPPRPERAALAGPDGLGGAPRVVAPVAVGADPARHLVGEALRPRGHLVEHLHEATAVVLGRRLHVLARRGLLAATQVAARADAVELA